MKRTDICSSVSTLVASECVCESEVVISGFILNCNGVLEIKSIDIEIKQDKQERISE